MVVFFILILGRIGLLQMCMHCPHELILLTVQIIMIMQVTAWLCLRSDLIITYGRVFYTHTRYPEKVEVLLEYWHIEYLNSTPFLCISLFYEARFPSKWQNIPVNEVFLSNRGALFINILNKNSLFWFDRKSL